MFCDGRMMNKPRRIPLITALIMVLSLSACNVNVNIDQGDKVKSINAYDEDLIGIAWVADTDYEPYTYVVRAIEEAGGRTIMLPQVRSYDLQYDDDGILMEGVADTGELTDEAGKLIKCNSWLNSNAPDAVMGVQTVIFVGGDDVSPSLFYSPKGSFDEEDVIGYSPERDVSDYLLMSCCLDNDIPFMGICRGEQMLAAVSGAENIPDIPEYFREQDVEYGYEHRNRAKTPGAYRDYVPHSVSVEKDSILYDMVGTDTVEGCPSWHHSGVENTDNTRLRVTGETDTNGITIIEAVERTDKMFAMGIQFHPEAAIVKHLDGGSNAGTFMDYDTALGIFRYIVEEKYLDPEEDVEYQDQYIEDDEEQDEAA